MSLPSIRRLFAPAALASLVAVGCAAPSGESEPDLATEESALTAQISPSDIARAEKLRDAVIWIPEPALGPGARMITLESGEFDGTASATHLVKDEDGRLFFLFTVDSAPDRSQLAGQHGQPPRFRDARYFLVLDPRGIDWALTNLPRVPSTRHGQVLWYKSSPHFTGEVIDLGRRLTGEHLVHFNAYLFVVKPNGFRKACEEQDLRVPSCEQDWLRVDNSPDPFDAP